VSGNQIADGAHVRIEIETKGKARSLPEIVEENILRVGQEAITNTVKHAGASQLSLELEFRPDKVVLAIRDNGHGFAPDNCLGPNQGHFGLLGMSERAKRLGGSISIDSAAGAGTTISLEIPVEETPNIHHVIEVGQSGEPTGYEEDIPDTDTYC
jgi:signal transduction histidine kinase